LVGADVYCIRDYAIGRQGLIPHLSGVPMLYKVAKWESRYEFKLKKCGIGT
jgi:hypothetical protein